MNQTNKDKNRTSLIAGTLLALVLFAPFFGLSAKARSVEGTVNLNLASASELTLLPGIGPAKAEAIVQYRKAHPFRATQELTEVPGISEKMFERLKPYLAVEGATTLREVSEPRPPASVSPAPTVSK